MLTRRPSEAFDYTGLHGDVRAKLKDIEQKISRARTDLATNIVEIGKQLSQVRELLKRQGSRVFCKWLEYNCWFSERTAYRYMDIYRSVKDFATVAKIEASALYELGAKDTSDSAILAVKNLANAGENVTIEDVKRLKTKTKNAAAARLSDSARQIQCEIGEALPDIPENANAEITKLHLEDESKDVEETTAAEKAQAHNTAVDSFCRSLMSFFRTSIPSLFWLDDRGCKNSAEASLRSAVKTLRSADCVECPACENGFQNEKHCQFCKAQGHLPKYIADQIPHASKRK